MQFLALLSMASSTALISIVTGFSVELIHRDSPLSPLFNRSATPAELARQAAIHSMAQAEASNGSGLDIQYMIRPNYNGTYLLKLLVGTPPTEIHPVMDTGSDLVSIQCVPCVQCFHQESRIFDPNASSTYQNVSCHSTSCHTLSIGGCAISSSEECRYSYLYVDGSGSKGVLAMETFKLDSNNGQGTEKLTNLVFGCGHTNQMYFTSGSSGVAGLGGGALSLISQLGAKVAKKFWYCLPMAADATSKLKFGINASISGGRVVSSPLLSNSMNPTNYFLALEGITVGGKIKIPNKKMAAG